MGKYQLCVSGASRGRSVEDGWKLARATGKAIAEAGHSLMTGATIGLPNEASIGYKKAGGHMSFGISPAATKIEHALKYRLPLKNFDMILYSGLHYIGRDSLLITSSDAVISIGGRIGTLHEFTIAIESETPIGLLQGAGGVGDEMLNVLKAAGREPGKLLVVSEDPVELVKKLTEILDKQNERYSNLYKTA